MIPFLELDSCVLDLSVCYSYSYKQENLTQKCNIARLFYSSFYFKSAFYNPTFKSESE